MENCHRRMLDAASYGAHCVLLSPAPGAGVARPADSAAALAQSPRAAGSGRATRPLLRFQFGRWLVRDSLGLWPAAPARAGGSCGKLSSQNVLRFRGFKFCGLQVSEAEEPEDRDSRCNGRAGCPI